MDSEKTDNEIKEYIKNNGNMNYTMKEMLSYMTSNFAEFKSDTKDDLNYLREKLESFDEKFVRKRDFWIIISGLSALFLIILGFISGLEVF